MSRAILVLVVWALSLVGCGGAEDGPRARSLLLVSADSLRADRLALWRPGEGVETPNLEELAKRGTRYERTWAVTPWTAPSMVSVFTGLYPPSHGVAYRDDTTPTALPTMPGVLEAGGLRVGNFSFFTGISYFRNLGFPEPVPGLQHGQEAELFDAWLEEGGAGTPFFAWIHLLHPHLPYGSSGYRAREVQMEGSTGLEASQLHATVPVGTVAFAPGDRGRLLELYDADIRELDREIGELLAVLERRDLEKETLVLFVADHGEELLEHGWVGHASTSMEAKLIPETLRIPLLLAGPGVPQGALSPDLVQHVDLLPTVLELLGLDPPAGLDGRSLVRTGPWRRLRELLSVGGERRFVFFDSSLGGNLTPPERRGERLQGVGDGDCLLVSHTLPGEERVSVRPVEAGECDESELRRQLARWRQEQGAKRLEVLRRASGEDPDVDPSRLEAFTEDLMIVEPEPGLELDWRQTGGQIVLEWQGAGPVFWLQYDVGREPLRLRGSFQTEQRRLVFGPFPPGFWNDLAGYSPFRFRVADPQAGRRSGWREFRVLSQE